MGREFFRLVQAAIASGALVIPGVEADAEAQDAPGRELASATSAPTIESVKLDARGLTVSFSEPVRPPAGVDPGKFRLTFAYYHKGDRGSYYYEYYGAHHRDLMREGITAYLDVGPQALAASIEQPSARQIRIPASVDLDLESICDDLSAASRTQERVGLYLHYAEPGSPGIVDARGKPLESIAPYWLEDDRRVTSGAFEGRPVSVSVTCS